MADTFRDLGTLTRWLRGLLLANAGLSVLSTGADFAAGGETGLSTDALDNIQLVVIGFRLVALATTFVVAGVWIYRAACNARWMASNLTITPGWAVGWYFMPIANLFKPFQAMSEIWRASASPVAWHEVPVPALLRIWWGLWIIGSILDVQAGRATMDGATPLSVTSDAFDAASCLAFFAVVGGLWALQKQSRSATGLSRVFS